MRVFLKNLKDEVCPIDIELSDDFHAVGMKIEEKTGIERSAQRLIYARKQLGGDGVKVSDFNIPEGAIIYITTSRPLERPSK